MLLVDDDPDQSVLVRDWLQEAYGGGCELSSVYGYESALSALDGGGDGYDACLVDHHLGAQTGLDLIRELRRRGCGTPLVMLTGSLDPRIDAEALAAGAADYLEKDGLNSRVLERCIRYTVDRRKAADALRASEERYRALVENAEEAVVVIDETGTPVFASAPLAQILGYSTAELLALDAQAILHPDDCEPCVAALRRCLATPGAVETLQLRHRRKDGLSRWLECVLVNRIAEPAVRGVVVNVRDVTDSVVMMQALRLQAEVSRVLADVVHPEEARPAILRAVAQVLQARVAVAWRVDEAGETAAAVEAWSRAGDAEASRFASTAPAITLTSGGGAFADAVSGRRIIWIEEVARSTSCPRCIAASEAGFSTLVLVPILASQHEVRAVLELGWEHPFESRPRLLEVLTGIGRQAGHFLERIEAQSALLARDRQLRALFDRGSDAIMIHDDEGHYVDANPPASALLGVPRERLIGSRVGDYVAPEHRGRVLEWFKTLRRAGEMEGEEVVVRADGARRIVDYRSTAHFMPGRHLLVLRDVTEQRRLEQQFLQLQKMENVGRLAGGIAHDFNNLLTAILGNADIVRAQIPPDGPVEEMDDVLKAAVSAAALTGQLLAFSRKQMMQTVAFDLNSAVAAMDRMLRRLIGEDIELSTVLRDDLPAAKADPAQIEQVVLNLAVNARDAMPDGGRLTIATGTAHIDAASAAQHAPMAGGDYVVLTVSDTGIGMDADTLAHIFEPFFTTKEQGRGTGLGLATVYGIVRQSGGHVSVDSTPGVGTTFRVYLPIAAGEQLTATDGPEAPEEGGCETVLVVEDAEPVRRLTAALLGKAGYRVLHAANGEEAAAVSAGHEGTIDLLLTDVVMPGMSGPEVFERLSRQRPGIRVIYCSGYTDDAIVRHGVARGRAFLQKPYTNAALLRTVREVLDGLAAVAAP